jgi:hypothetical protein
MEREALRARQRNREAREEFERLLDQAIRNDLDASFYLKDVLAQLLSGVTDYESLCPHVWKLAHPEAVRRYRVDERRDAADRQRLRRLRKP